MGEHSSSQALLPHTFDRKRLTAFALFELLETLVSSRTIYPLLQYFIHNLGQLDLVEVLPLG